MDRDRDVVGPPGCRDVTAVVVDYFAGRHLLSCIESLRGDGIAEIVVVDHSGCSASEAVLGQERQGVTVIEPAMNRGFGAGVNVGLTAGTSPYVLVCNPDVMVQAGLTTSLVDRMAADPRLAVVGPATTDAEGRPRQTARAFPCVRRSALHAFVGLLWPTSPAAERYRARNTELCAQGTADWVSGACFLARRSALATVRGFDESYFMYLEELDLCWRLAEAGWRVGYHAGATAMHVGGVSAAQHPYRMLSARHRSMWRFARRSAHRGEVALLPLAAIGIVARYVLCLAGLAARSLSGRTVLPPP